MEKAYGQVEEVQISHEEHRAREQPMWHRSRERVLLVMVGLGILCTVGLSIRTALSIRDLRADFETTKSVVVAAEKWAKTLEQFGGEEREEGSVGSLARLQMVSSVWLALVGDVVLIDWLLLFLLLLLLLFVVVVVVLFLLLLLSGLQDTV